jgi:DNA polymerase
MDMLTIDFETFYSKDYSLSKITTEAYVNDIRFEAIGIAVKRNNEPTRWFTGSYSEIKGWLSQFDWGNSMVIAHNAMFDGAILGWRFGIYPKAVVCTLSMARALHAVSVGGSLAALAEYYRLGVKGTEVLNAIGKRRLDFSKTEMDAYGSYCINDVELTYKLFKAMLPKIHMRELKLVDMTIRMYTDPMLKLDTDMLYAHLADVREQKEKLLEECGINKDDLMSNQKFASVLEMFGVEPPTKINSKGLETYAFAKTDEGFKALAEHDDPRVQAIVAARLGTKSTLEETRTQRFIEISDRPYRDSLLPVPLMYYGARTGRWSATDKINLQNLPRKSKLKGAIVAPDGYVIVGADLSAIELRMGLAFAGQLDKMRLLGEGIDLYKDFASTVYNIPISEITDGQRFMGKTAQLSLIYGTGSVKLRNQVKLMSGKDIGAEEAKRIVTLYRNEYTEVVDAWGQGDEVLECVLHNNAMYMGRNNLIAVHGAEGALLPSGLYMRYPDLRKDKVETTRGLRWEWSVMKNRRERDKLYGSKVFQGITQALARCIIAEAMLRIEKEYRILLTIHDACYLLAREDEANDVLRFVIQQLRVPPVWMPDIPLDAEGGYGRSLEFKMGKVL